MRITHWGRRSASERKKPAPLFTAFIIQNFPQPDARLGVGEAPAKPKKVLPSLPDMWMANSAKGTLVLQRSKAWEWPATREELGF